MIELEPSTQSGSTTWFTGISAARIDARKAPGAIRPNARSVSGSPTGQKAKLDNP